MFDDTRLSGNGTQSCASCHDPGRAFTDNRILSRGATGEVHPRNAPTLINIACNPTFDGGNAQRRTLEEQMRTPLLGTTLVETRVNDSN